jgi:hypothetical protein
VGIEHPTHTCDGCNAAPLCGTRWHCLHCADFDLCGACVTDRSHDSAHVFVAVERPGDDWETKASVETTSGLLPVHIIRMML